MQNRFRRPRGDPPRRGHKCALRPPNAVICYESATFANWKTRAQKSDKNEKTFLKKWVWRQLHTLGTSGAASLKKGCLAHSKNQCFCKMRTTLQRETRCASICCKTQCFCKICLMKKKVEKSEIEQNICVLPIRMQFLCKNHINLQSSCEATKSQQQKTTPRPIWFYRGKMKVSL